MKKDDFEELEELEELEDGDTEEWEDLDDSETPEDDEDIEKLPLADVFEILNTIDNKKILVGSNAILASPKYKNALNNYAEDEGYHPLALLDNTFWGSAKNGCLVTTGAIYARQDDKAAPRKFELTPDSLIQFANGGDSLALGGKPFFCFKYSQEDDVKKIVSALRILIKSEDLGC